MTFSAAPSGMDVFISVVWRTSHVAVTTYSTVARSRARSRTLVRDERHERLGHRRSAGIRRRMGQVRRSDARVSGAAGQLWHRGLDRAPRRSAWTRSVVLADAPRSASRRDQPARGTRPGHHDPKLGGPRGPRMPRRSRGRVVAAAALARRNRMDLRGDSAHDLRGMCRARAQPSKSPRSRSTFVTPEVRRQAPGAAPRSARAVSGRAGRRVAGLREPLRA